MNINRRIDNHISGNKNNALRRNSSYPVSQNTYGAKNNSISQIAVFDFILAILSLLLLSDNFWQIGKIIFPNSRILADDLMFEIFKSAILSMGFVGIAVKWEMATKILGRFFILIIGAALCLFSVLWSQDPAASLHQAINFTLLIAFSFAISLRFGLEKLSIIALSFSIFSIFMQSILLFGDFIGLENLLFKNGEIAFALMAAIWAYYAQKNNKIIFASIAAFCALIGIFTQDMLSISVIIASFCAIIMQAIYSKSKSIEIGIAGAISIYMFLCALLVLTIGPKASDILSNLYSELNLQTILGNGYGVGMNNIAGYFGTGLGFLGLMFGLLFLFFSLAIITIKAKSHKYAAIPIFGLFAMIFIGIDKFAIISLPVVFFIAAIASSLKVRS